MPNNQELKPTDEQINIVDKYTTTGDNLLVNALAGTGKTTMLKMLALTLKGRPALYIAFAKSDVKEAEQVLPSTCLAKTMNSMGLKCWSDGNGRAVTDPKKIFPILSETLNAYKGQDREELSDSYWEILEAIKMARHIGYIPERWQSPCRRLTDRNGLSLRVESRLSDLAWEVVDNVLITAIQASYAGSVDFDDQVYMPALFGGSFSRFPDVLIDETQDQSPTGIALLERLTKQSRVGAVGDRWQSIYYFRGAEIGGVEKIKHKFNMVELPLSISFRCPRVIVEAARWRVPHFQWIKDGGIYDKLQHLDPAEIPDRYRTDEETGKKTPEVAIVCRNNAPLFRVAFALLSRKRSVQVAGSEIGPKIVRLLKKIGTDQDTQEDLLIKIEEWRQEQLETSNAIETVNDTAECLKIFASWGSNLGQTIGYAEHIFKQSGTIQLTTGHKAKGKEWDIVYHLDPWLLKKDDQDLNLKYVITTRAKEALYEINSQEIDKW